MAPTPELPERPADALPGDPAVTDAELYHVVMENERVRVLEYRDRPGDQTTMHHHPDSVMVTLSAFRRRLEGGGQIADVELVPGEVRWLAEQAHAGQNTGDSETHVILVELKEPRRPDAHAPDVVGPVGPTRS